MPLIQIVAPEGKLNKKDQDKLVKGVSNAVLNAERAPLDHAGAQSLTWAYYIEQAEGTLYVGGNNIDNPPFRIAITTPEGALTPSTRKSLIEEIGSLVDDVVGPFQGRLNHWVMLTELDEGSWAGSGQIFPLAGIQAAMNIKAA